MQYEVIIPAAGSGTRMGANFNKLFLQLNGQTIIERTVRVFAEDPNCTRIILAVKEEETDKFKQLLQSAQEKVLFIPGGKERQFSVKNGLAAVSPDCEIVLVHDGARPLIKKPYIDKLVEAANRYGSAVLAVPVKDTIKRVENFAIQETLNRENLWAIQTPQAFRVKILQNAHLFAETHAFLGTDEASLVERMDEKVMIVAGSYENIKITTAEDIGFANVILQQED